MKSIILLSAALVASMVSAQATTQNAAPDAAAVTNSNPEAAMTALFGDPTIVKADAFVIKRSDYDQLDSSAKAQAAAGNQPWRQEDDIMILNQLIAIKVLGQMANDDDRATGKQLADKQYTNLVAQFGSADEFQRMLNAKGITVADLRAKATQEAVAVTALKRLLNINITDAEAKDYYDKHPTTFEQPELVHARHILLLTIDPSTRPPTPLSTNTIAAKRKEIEDLRKRIIAGEDFATLAKQYSEDNSSKGNGGELPLFKRGEMVPEFDSAAFSLKTNEVSEVITTQYGFHLIKVLDKTPAKTIDFATAEPDIREGLAQQQIRKLAPDYVKKLRADQHVEILDPNLKALSDQVEAQAAAAAATGGGTTK